MEGGPSNKVGIMPPAVSFSFFGEVEFLNVCLALVCGGCTLRTSAAIITPFCPGTTRDPPVIKDEQGSKS